jgi:hypothetical protein
MSQNRTYIWTFYGMTVIIWLRSMKPGTGHPSAAPEDESCQVICEAARHKFAGSGLPRPALRWWRVFSSTVPQEAGKFSDIAGVYYTNGIQRRE